MNSTYGTSSQACKCFVDINFSPKFLLPCKDCLMTQASPHPILPFRKSCLGIEKLPLEVFAKVCNNLEPIWLWNLSHVCQSTHRRLSFAHGNLIWYNVMPVSLWKEAERFQCNEELRVAMMPAERVKYQGLQALKKSPEGGRALSYVYTRLRRLLSFG